MRRVKKHKVKHEKPETSTSYTRELHEHDLAYYIHDRVELMHQVFSVLKHKDLKAMAPECIRRISVDDLQELCTEELLGISSKRLCAILDGADPPSDTESSSASPSPQMETISLDSISSDEEILSQSSSKKKKHKHKRRGSKSKKTKKSKELEEEAENVEKSKASRAGLTVLELLELQARARAIRAQLQKEQISKQASETAPEPHESDNDEVEIKEEPAEVVEISSEDEKPSIEELEKANPPSTSKGPETNKETARETATESTNREKERNKKKNKKDKKEKKKKDTEKEIEITKETNKNVETENPQTVTKRINDLIITVPQQSNRKIKLNRSKVTISLPKVSEKTVENSRTVTVENTKTVSSVVNKPTENINKVSSVITKPTIAVETEKKTKDKPKKVKKKDKRKNSDNSDQDEITLQLSDTEKMDLLEDFDRKDYEQVSSSDSESSSESDSNSSDENTQGSSIDENAKENSFKNNHTTTRRVFEVKSSDQMTDNNSEMEQAVDLIEETEVTEEKDEETMCTEKDTEDLNKDISIENESETVPEVAIETIKENEEIESTKNGEVSTVIEKEEQVIEIENINDIPLREQNDSIITEEITEKITEQITVADKEIVQEVNIDTELNVEKTDRSENLSDGELTDRESSEVEVLDLKPEVVCISDDETSKKKKKKKEINTETELNEVKNDKSENLSDGELSNRESSEVEALNLRPEVVCITDDETSKKKKKKKDKKVKKDKKKKSKSDFQEGNDENFYKDTIVIDDKEKDLNDYDDVYEILELSDDSSCYEVEGTFISKEPTAEEIAALSAKIDEIKREDVVTDEQIKEHEREQDEKEIENISWKDRYLDSRKVKKVLTTSNILNALRKKNIELKKKLEESKKADADVAKEDKEEEKEEEKIEEKLEEGSIEHYNTLEGSTKFVDPVPENIEKTEIDVSESTGDNIDKSNGDTKIEIQVTGEMKKDAKQLLKMYKKLLKYNDINKQKDSSKKKKKKKKKDKDGAVST